MLKVRTNKVAPGNIAVQVVYRHNHKTEIVKHIGTARSQKEKEQFISLGNQYIAENKQMPPLLPQVFSDGKKDDFLISLKHLKVGETSHAFAYEILSHFYQVNGFDKVNNTLLRDLAFMRLIEPSSKLRAVELLKEYFHITYPINSVYEGLRSIEQIKEETEKAAVTFAQKHLSFDFSLVFYDVTTLYFETFKEDEDTTDEKGHTIVGLRKNGFGKEKKPGQPLILIGLLVTREGYPVAVEIFEGNTFEGKTMIPSILRFQEKYHIKTLTIVADAGMLSFANMEELKKHNLTYIVGARMGNLTATLIQDLAVSLRSTEGIYVKRETPHGTLICDYSKKRASKDKSDREKQIRKAQRQIEEGDPVLKRIPFLKEKTKTIYKLNLDLIEKDKLLDGLKGYYANVLGMDESLIVARYKDLWHVEKAFRIVKSDLEARPIFHHKRESIAAHIGIVFVSLCLTKSIELQTGYSIKKVMDSIWSILDIELIDTLTNRRFIKRMVTEGNEIVQLFEKLSSVHKSVTS
ncbi:MAG: IS1634 family transposase [Nitrosotalea sp.]